MPAERALPAPAAARPRRMPGWLLSRGVKRLLTLLFFGAVIGLLAYGAHSIDWDEVLTALQALPASALWAASGVAAASFIVYSGYDLIGRRITGHGVPASRVALIGIVSYAFNLNLGSLVGGIAFRYRLYAKAGLATEVITKVLLLSLITNWLGYLVLAGLVFMLAPLSLPPSWPIGSGSLRMLGAGLIVVALVYLAACAFATRRVWHFRSRSLRLPSGGTAALQLAVSAANWLLIAGVIHVLLQQRVDYPTVLGVLLIAAVAGVITHVPAGVGVLEAVFVALLSPRVPHNEVLAALLAYRAVYYLGPLAVATGLLVLLERLPAVEPPATPQERALP